jgi:drug/metabolite transporter (DMT)-like permease
MTGVLFPGSNIAGKYTTLDPGPLTITVLRYFITQLFLSGLLHYKSSAPIPLWRDIVPALLSGLFGIVAYPGTAR